MPGSRRLASPQWVTIITITPPQFPLLARDDHA
jgi:hypothetical protein